MNLPNKLTLARLGLTVMLVAVLLSGLPGAPTLGLVLFVAASLTDYFDGYFARRDGLVTNFGILMDPLVDKILICSTFIVFVERGWVEAWMAALIVARELAITGLRLLAASRNIVLAAESFGKHKTTSQIVAIIALLVAASYTGWGAWANTVFGTPILGKPWVRVFAEAAKWLAVLLTVLSGSIYLWRNRHLYVDDL